VRHAGGRAQTFLPDLFETSLSCVARVRRR
jgi:hypothetical protein